MQVFNSDFEIQVKTFYGLEELLAKELLTLGAKNIETRNRAVVCTGDLGFLYKVNYSARLALKVTVPIFDFSARDENDFYNQLLAFPWETYMTLSQTFAIDATVNSETFTQSRFMTYRLKDAIVDRFNQVSQGRPEVDTQLPDIKFHLHIDQNKVCVSLDSSGEPLYKRGYKKEQVKAPINEVLAAGILHLAGWDGKGNFLDPMCGSGTLLMEAAMMATNLPAQIFRQDFGFMRWGNYDADLFKKIKEFRLNRVKDFTGKIIGYDQDRKAVEIARENIYQAELDEIIEIKHCNFFDSKKEHFPLLVVFNPPYDERLEIENDDFYKQIGDTLKSAYPNCLTWFISADLDAHKKVGLRPSRRIKLFNANLECRLLQYETYEGSKKEKFQHKD
jgi:putative N6-adenine-specific DNA methylase